MWRARTLLALLALTGAATAAFNAADWTLPAGFVIEP